MATYTLNVNGQSHSVTVPSADLPLLWVLRDYLGLTGAGYGCESKVCGACKVLVNGHPEKSCDMSLSEAVGRQIMTVEGFAADAGKAGPPAIQRGQPMPQGGVCLGALADTPVR